VLHNINREAIHHGVEICLLRDLYRNGSDLTWRMRVQVTTQDSSDPHTLADRWAQTLGWEVEPSDEEFIRRMIKEGYASEDDTAVHN
jgi:hypothetical protein